MANDAVVLNVAEMAHVSLIWGQAVAEWQLRVYAATIHPTHAHVIFAPMARDVTTVIAGLKRRSAPPHLWTARPWPVYIDDSGNHLPNAIEYVRDHNRRVDRPADPYPWIDPLYPPR